MRNFEIIIGTYEEFLLGYKLDIRNEQPALIQTFADKSHSGSIKSVAVHGHWIATGATDDRIFIYDMRTRKQSQILLTHDGTINALAFTPDESHLLSGGDDGQMLATRIKTWLTEGSWKKAHNGSAVTHISCHPSGKLALSLGSDLVLRTWNLVKGRVAYKTNLKSRNTLGFMPDCLAWSTSGEYFSITGQRVVEIWTIKSADVIRSVKTAAKPVCLSWISDDVCLVGLEDGKILWLNINEPEEQQNEKSIEAHDTRVKAMCFFEGSLVTASSAGEVKVWDVLLGKNKLKEVAATNVGCRPTCLAVLDLKQFGDDYVLTKTIKEYKEEPVKQKTANHPLQRGIVQIEYENDDDEDDKIGNLSAEDKPNDDSDDDVSEDDDDDSAAAQASSNEDNDDDDDDDDEDDHGDDEINHDREPQIRLPKSRKHKQLIQNTQIKAKKAKLEQKTVKKAKQNDVQKKSKSAKNNSPQKNILKQLGKAKKK